MCSVKVTKRSLSLRYSYNNFTPNPFYDTSDCSTNHLTLKEHNFMCLIVQEILKVKSLRRYVLITLVFLKNRNVVGM